MTTKCKEQPQRSTNQSVNGTVGAKSFLGPSNDMTRSIL